MDGAARPHLFGMTPDGLAQLMAERGVACTITEARRICGHVISSGRDDLDLVRPVRRSLLTALETHVDRRGLEVVERVVDDYDGFTKYLFRHHDGALTEAVRIPLEKPGRYTVCLSSQVGCAMQCVFCATGRLGLTRSLMAWEMVAAFRAVRQDTVRELPDHHVSGAVFQGQGEPLHNYDEVIAAAKILSEPCGGRIAKEAITISTVGLVPQIRRYAREKHPYRLIVSLTSAVPERRLKLLPVAGRFAMPEVAEALRELYAAVGGRLTIAWVLMRRQNHGSDEVEALKKFFGALPLRVNLIDVNDATGSFERVTERERVELVQKLQAAGIATRQRYSGGRSKLAACGMLASARLGDADGA
jgi:23S rRNA (adenine2503-C2)-methyltransferase